VKEGHKINLLSEILATEDLDRTELDHLIYVTGTAMAEIWGRPKRHVQEKGGFYSQRRAHIKPDKCRKGVSIPEVTKQVKKKYLNSIKYKKKIF
jgi:hypothetical protein